MCDFNPTKSRVKVTVVIYHGNCYKTIAVIVHGKLPR